MTQEAMHAQMGGETGGTEEYIEAGAVTFGLEYRTGVGAMNDEGICIHVYGNDLEGDDKELLRFDCSESALTITTAMPPSGKTTDWSWTSPRMAIRWSGRWTKSGTDCPSCSCGAKPIPSPAGLTSAMLKQPCRILSRGPRPKPTAEGNTTTKGPMV